MKSPNRFLSAAFAALLVASPMWAEAPDELAGLRALASALLKAGPGKDTSVVLEYQVNRQSNACTNQKPESSVRLHGDGRVDLLITRSFAETGRSGPGFFQGKLDKPEWDTLFSKVARMKWVETEMLLPMPGMSESNFTLMVRKGGKEGRYSITGSIPPDQTLLSDGLDAASDLVPLAKADTVWAISLVGSKATPGKQGLSVLAEWTLRGRQAMRMRMPGKEPSPACGSVELRWHTPGKEKKGVTALPPEIHSQPPAAPPPGEATWRDIGPGAPLRAELAFAMPKGKPGARQGRLIHLGIPIALPGRGDTLAVITLFSAGFPF